MLACTAVLALAAPATAQELATNFRELRLKVAVGDRVYVTDLDGREREVTILDLSESLLTVSIDGQRTDLAEARVRRIRQRLPDRLRNGVLIGFVVGAVSMATLVKRLESPVGSCQAGCMTAAGLGYGGVGAAIGAGVDALVKSKRTIYESSSPLMRHQGTRPMPGAGVTFTLRF